ncbi:MAG: hypothetical protein EXQ55_07845 [Acidobacteria bacterium]|nr:hypothetical protein [Acidobacteriota bacterium]
MQRSHLAAVVLTLLAAGLAVSAAAQTKPQDHPLVLPMGPYQKGKFTKTERVEGKVTRLAYVNPRDRSTLEIFRN